MSEDLIFSIVFTSPKFPALFMSVIELASLLFKCENISSINGSKLSELLKSHWYCSTEYNFSILLLAIEITL